MKTKWKIIICIAVILIIARLLLPYIVLQYVNNKLAGLEEYQGRVEDIDIALIRGAYVINNITILKKVKENKRDKNDTIPFFSSPEIDLSIQWKALFKGRIVGEIYVEHGVLSFVKGTHKGENISADTTDFRKLIRDLMPLTINYFQINNSFIHYIDPNSEPYVDVFMEGINVEAENLSNVEKRNVALPSTVIANGKVYEGNFNLNLKLDALAEAPTFDLDARLVNLNLPALNNFLRAYGNFDVKAGEFNMYTEFAAKKGEFGGYVKPIVKNLDIVQWNKEEGNFKQILWETIVGASAAILKNQRKDQLASKIEIEGKFSDSSINIWKAISYLLRNAFVNALKPAIDNTININHIDGDKKTILERIFSKKVK
jgi:hypothetical protein